MLLTKRLILRQWVQEDFIPFADMCQDKQVMEFFPKAQTPEESYTTGKKIQSLINERGWGFWAVEIPNQCAFIGFVGLHIPDNMPFSPCVEIGWRLAKEHWGHGYATEAAQVSLGYAFTELDLNEVVSFTTVSNIRSQAVMKKIGMSNTSNNFMHPNIDSTHPLCEHVLYKVTKDEWQENEYRHHSNI